MTQADKELIEQSEAIERSLKDPEKPADLTPEQSQRWDDVEHDRQLMINEGPMAKGFRLFGKGNPEPGPLKKEGR